MPYLFSPDFNYQLDFNYRDKQIVIKETETQFVHVFVSRDLINTEWNRQTGENIVMLILSRIKWESETVLRIVNESNIECFFEIRTTDPSDSDSRARYLHLLSAAKIDNLHENCEKLDSPHLLSDR